MVATGRQVKKFREIVHSLCGVIVKYGDGYHCYKCGESEAPIEMTIPNITPPNVSTKIMGDEMISTITESTNDDCNVQIAKECFVTAQQ